MEEGGVSFRHRFAGVSESKEAAMLEQAVPDATQHATKFWMSVFNWFCHEIGLTLDLTSCSAVKLDGVLGKFYAGLRTKTGGFYKCSSYLAARTRIQRHLGALNRRLTLSRPGGTLCPSPKSQHIFKTAWSLELLLCDFSSCVFLI